MATLWKPRGDINAVAHQVAVALLDHVAQMNADAELNALVWRDLSVALDHRPLDLDGAVNSVDDAPELDDRAVAGPLDNAAVMHRDCGIDQVAPKGAKPSESSILVRARKPGVADDVSDQDRREFPGLAHGAIAEAGKSPVAMALAWLHVHAALGGGRGSRKCRSCVSAREAYPRRAERSTVGGGAIDDGCRAATSRQLGTRCGNRQVGSQRVGDS